MARARKRRSGNNSIVAFFQKDPFGVTWFMIFYIAVLIAKWWYIEPPEIDPQSCLACATILEILMAMGVTVLISLFWILWLAKRQKKNLLFLFLICLAVIGCTGLLDVASQEIFSRLYFHGFLKWQGADVTYLLDVFLRHNAGLYLGVLMVYAMLRMAIDPEFSPRKYVVSINLAFAGVGSFLLLMGVVLY
jgi:hypothetical protein